MIGGVFPPRAIFFVQERDEVDFGGRQERAEFSVGGRARKDAAFLMGGSAGEQPPEHRFGQITRLVGGEDPPPGIFFEEGGEEGLSLGAGGVFVGGDRKSTRLNSSHT